MRFKTYWKIYKVIAIGVGTYTLLKQPPVRRFLYHLVSKQGEKLLRK